MISLKVKFLSTFKDKTIGLLGKNSPEPVFLKTRFGIHTFGLKFPIDVLILDEKNKVVKLKENLKPNSFFFWNPKYNKVLELPQEGIKLYSIKMNSFIDITT